MNILKKLRSWCPQPRDPFASKLKRHSAPIAVLLTATLFTVSFSIFSSTYLFNQLAPQVPIVNMPSSSSSNPSTPPAIEWEKTYAGIYAVNLPSKVIQTRDGGYLMVGTTNHKYVLPVVWLVKIDSQGDMQWNQTLEVVIGNLTYCLNNAAGVVQTSDDGYVIVGNEIWFNTGEFDPFPKGSIVILFRLDSLGNIEGNQTYGKNYDNGGGASSMIQTSDGGYAIAGGGDLIKATSSGEVQWSKTYNNDNFVSVIQTNDGGYALLTNDNELFKVNSNGDVEWSQKYPAGSSSLSGQSGAINSVIQTSDGGYALVGNKYPINSENSVAWLTKTNSKGAVEWNQTYGSPESVANNLIQTSDDGYAFVGTWHGSPSMVWLLKTDTIGSMQWNLTVNTIDNQTITQGDFYGNDLIETKDGGFALACTYDSSGSYVDTYYYLVKTEPSLPPPTPTPTPSSPPSTSFLSGENLLLFTSSALAVVLIAIVAVAVLRRRKKQTLAST